MSRRTGLAGNRALCALVVGLATAGAALYAAGGALAGTATRSDATTVTVTFTAKRFSISRPGAPAGTVTFMAVNKGPTARVLKVVGPGVKGSRTLPVPAGKSAQLTMAVSKGAYMLLDVVAHPPTAHWLVVTPAANVSSTGNGSVVTPITVTTGMNCD
jgi:hypothetical protein